MTIKLEVSSDIAHGRILQAYLARISDADLAAVLAARKECTYAGAQLGTSAQLAAHEKEAAACQRAVDGMLAHDRENIARIIASAIQSRP